MTIRPRNLPASVRVRLQALLLIFWRGSIDRATRDLDLTGYGYPNSLVDAETKATQWQRSLRRHAFQGGPQQCDVTEEALRAFVRSPLKALPDGRRFAAEWEAGLFWP
jgi:hypothetical protein